MCCQWMALGFTSQSLLRAEWKARCILAASTSGDHLNLYIWQNFGNKAGNPLVPPCWDQRYVTCSRFLLAWIFHPRRLRLSKCTRNELEMITEFPPGEGSLCDTCRTCCFAPFFEIQILRFLNPSLLYFWKPHFLAFNLQGWLSAMEELLFPEGLCGPGMMEQI